MKQKFSLTTEETDIMAAAVRQDAIKNGWSIALAIVDEAGILLRLDRMDGAGPMAPEIATGKAQMAVLTRRTSKFWEDRVAARPGFLKFPFGLPIQGGVSIFHQGQCVGAIGISGVASEEDEQLALGGIAACGDILSATI